ncbi:MAG: peptide MFS transporter [Polyangiaceae bacterium]
MSVRQRHPRGLYVLFAAEMWERFSFYSMLAMFTLYLQSPTDGFAWTRAQATGLYANYMMFVYASPIIGGLLADWKLGRRRSVMLGAVFFMAGHLLLSIQSLAAVYGALCCLVIGNGFFKPNVSAMVGGLYPEGSPLKDRAYNIFYMGINVGAFLAPVCAELVKSRWGFHPAFAMAAGGMAISLVILAVFKKDIERQVGDRTAAPVVEAREVGDPATAADVGPTPEPRNESDKSSDAKAAAMAKVPDAHRIGALVVIYLLVIVFWMVFHQNGSTLTYFADNNTAWRVSGVISNAINPFFVVTLTFPLVWVWKRLADRKLEPSTPAKMAIGMFLTAVAFYIMYFAGISGGDTGRVSPVWLISAYGVITLGELMLSPMGLSLVSKVAPTRMRSLMMGGWFLATAIGNKLTAIGVYWDEWRHSSFFALLATMALFMAIVLALLLRPLKKAMPGV